MSKPAIKVQQLSKRYRLGAVQPLDRSFREMLAAQWPRLVGRAAPGPATDREFWALRDVSFEVQRGEVLGVIGRNGAGKSTLLKVLSRITDPTEGEVAIRGRVASLLEVGSGFHPELTGRENIFLNGAILGMTTAEVRRKFDEIVAFAGIERFLDTPVKRYSSGMYVRLAFAVAAHLEAELLIIDEVLAVGDAEFQRKCLGKMRDVARHSGRTVLFVSHNMAAVTSLCQRGLLLDDGALAAEGPMDEIVSRYLTSQSSQTGEKRWSAPCPEQDPGLRLHRAAILGGSGTPTADLDIRRDHIIEIDFEVREPLPFLRCGFWIATPDGAIVLSSYDADVARYAGRRQVGRFVSRCRLPANLLNVGDYHLTLHADIPGIRRLHIIEGALTFRVHETGGVGAAMGGGRRGLVRPQLDWNVLESMRLAA